MKKLLPIFLVAFSYLFLFLIFFFCYLILGLISDDNYLLLLVILFLGLITLIFIPNMIYAWLLPKLGYNEEKILFLNMVLKLCFIPFNCFLVTNLCFGFTNWLFSVNHGSWDTTWHFFNWFCFFMFNNDIDVWDKGTMASL